MRGLRIATLALALLALPRCGADEVLEPPRVQPTLASIQAEVFTPSCALTGCHGRPDPQLGQDLTAGSAHASIVGVASVEHPELLRVAPGDPGGSYLFLKITGDPAILGDRMPLGAAPLDSGAIEAIRRWIELGAPEE